MLRHVLTSAFEDIYSTTSAPVDVAPSKEELEIIYKKAEEERRIAEQARLEAEAAANSKKKPPAKASTKDVPLPPPPPVEVPVIDLTTKLPRTSFILSANHFSAQRDDIIAEAQARDTKSHFDNWIDVDAVVQDHLSYLRAEVGYVEPVNLQDFNSSSTMVQKSVPLKSKLASHEPFSTDHIVPEVSRSNPNTPPTADRDEVLEMDPQAMPTMPSPPPKRNTGSGGGNKNASLRAMSKQSKMSETLRSGSIAAPPSETAEKMFVITPQLVEFNNWSVGETYEEVLTILNSDSQSRRVRIKPPANPYFSITVLTPNFNSQYPMAPGVMIKYNIRFSPQTSEAQETELYVGTTREVQGSSAAAAANAVWSTFVIKVRAHRPPPRPVFNDVSLSPILPCGTTQTTAILRNIGGEGTFTLRCAEGSFAPMVVTPTTVALRTGQDAIINFSITTDKPGRYSRTLVLECDYGGAVTTYGIHSECVNPEIVLTSLNEWTLPAPTQTTTIQFDPVCFGSTPSKLMTFHNHGNIPVPFTWNCNTTAFRIHPVSGVLIPSGGTTFEIFFEPSSLGEVHGTCLLKYMTGTVLHTLNVLGEAVPMKAIITPTHINTVIPTLLRLTNTRTITIYNPNDKDMTFVIDPLPGEEHPSLRLTPQQQRDRDMRRERGNEPKAQMQARSVVRGVKFEYSVTQGTTIPPMSFQTITINFTLLKQEAEGSIEIWIDGMESSMYLTYQLSGRGPCVQVVPGTVDFGVVPLNGEGEARITIQNTNEIPITYTMQSARDMVRLANGNVDPNSGEEIAPWYTFLPSTGTLRPWGSAIVTVYLRGIEPGPVSDIIEVALDNCGVSKFLEVCADVHMPQACILKSVLSIPTLFHNVLYTSRVCLQNLSSVDVRYQWLIPTVDNLTLEFIPSRGVLSAGAKEHYVTVNITVSADHKPGTPLDIFAAVGLENGNETLLPLNIVCDDVRCMSVSIGHDLEAACGGMTPESFINIFLKNIANTVLKQPVLPYVNDVDMGVVSLVPGEPYAVKSFALTVTNHSHCVGRYEMHVHKFKCSTTATKQELSSTQLRLQDTPKLGFTAKELSGIALEENLALGNRIRAEEALVHGRGVGIEICNASSSGKLQSLESIVFDVRVHANLPLTFNDFIVFRCGSLPIMRLPVTLRCRMQPVVVEGNVSGLTLPLDGTDGIPILNFPPQISNVPKTIKTLRIVNRTPRDLHVQAQLFPDRYMLSGLLRTTSEEQDNTVPLNATVSSLTSTWSQTSPTSPNSKNNNNTTTKSDDNSTHPLSFSLGLDPPTHRPNPFTIVPQSFVLKALQCKTVTLEYCPTEVGKHTCTLKFISQIIQNEASTAYFAEEFYMENKPIGEATVVHADPEVAKDGLKINRLSFRRPVVKTSAITELQDPVDSHMANGEVSSDDEKTVSGSRNAEEEAYAKRVRDAKDRRDQLSDERDKLNAYVAKRWAEVAKDQAELSIPLEIDVFAEAVEPKLIADPPAILHLPNCKGGSPPYDVTSNRRDITLRNASRFETHFTCTVSEPFEIVMKKRAPTSSGASESSQLSSTIIKGGTMLRGDESAIFTVSLPWTLALQSQYTSHAISNTQDGIEVNGSLAITFSNGCVQTLPIQALVHMPRLCIEPTSLCFPHPSTKQKHLTLLNYTHVQAEFTVVPSANNRGIPAFTISGANSGVVPAANVMGIPGAVQVMVDVVPTDPLSFLEPEKSMVFEIRVNHGATVRVEVSKMY